MYISACLTRKFFLPATAKKIQPSGRELLNIAKSGNQLSKIRSPATESERSLLIKISWRTAIRSCENHLFTIVFCSYGTAWEFQPQFRLYYSYFTTTSKALC